MLASLVTAGLVVALELAPSVDEPSLSYGLQVGYRAGRFGVSGRVEHSTWMRFDTSGGFFLGTLDVAIGGEVRYLHGRAVTSLHAGTATLLAGTLLDDAGDTGLFLDIRPLGIRFPIGRSACVRLDPLHLAVVAPVLGGIPLVQVQYRTTVSLEWSL